jgi:hypothetical protein
VDDDGKPLKHPRSAGTVPVQRVATGQCLGEILQSRAGVIGLRAWLEGDATRRAGRFAGQDRGEGKRLGGGHVVVQQPGAAFFAAHERHARRRLDQRGHQCLLHQTLASGKGPEPGNGLLPADQHLLHAAGMDRSLEQHRARRRKTPQVILHRACLGKGRRIDHGVLRSERRAIEGRADEQAEVGHPPHRRAREFVSQPHARAGRDLVRGRQFDVEVMDEALSHG